MRAVGAGAPKPGPLRSRVSGASVAAVCVIALAACGGGSNSATNGTAEPTTDQTATAQPSPAMLTPFPDGNSYWRNSVGAPVVAYKTDSQMCFFYWAGLGYMPVFSGSMSEVLKQWNWTGIEGRYPYGGAPGSTSAVTMIFTPDVTGSGVWYVDGVFGFDPTPVAEGSPDPATQNDVWVPSSREQASQDYITFLGLPGQEFETPSLTSCPSSADFS